MKIQCLLFIILVAAVFHFTACQKPERNNPWDSKSDPDIWAPKNIEIIINSANSLTIIWDYNAILPEGFILDRKTGDGSWDEGFAVIKPGKRSYLDSTVNLHNFLYVYRLYAYADINHSKKHDLEVGGDTTGIVKVVSPVTGKTWMDRNLGADRAATSSTDATAYGSLYQWGRWADGHQRRNSPATGNLSTSDMPGHGGFITNSSSPWDWRSPQNDNLWQGENGTNNPCPNGYRLPTKDEWEAEYQSWSSNDASGAFASPLKLPLAGFRNYNSGSLYDVGSYGSYWSSTVDGSFTYRLYFGSINAGIIRYFRAYGYSVRCIKD